MNKYIKVALFSIKKETKFMVDYISSLFAYFIHILVFSFVWDFVLKDKVSLEGYTKDDLIWYVLIGEFILFTITNTNREISAKVKNGDVAVMLTKPINFVLYIISEKLSDIIKIIFNAVMVVILGGIMTSGINVTLLQMIIFLTSVVLAIIISIMLDVIIGLASFFIEEVKSLYLMISKAMLILVFSPLEMFPMWAQIIFRFLPTTYTVYAPAKILVKFELYEAINLLIMQVISVLFCMGILVFEYKKGVKKINVNGG